MDFNDFLLVASKLKKDVEAALISSEAYRKEVKEIPAIVEGRRQREELDNLSKKLEAAIESRKASGEYGKDGVNGRDGYDGKDGTCGSDGSHGADGASGSDGSDAVHVTDADIDFDNRFTFSMSDGSELVTSNGLNLEDAVKAFGRGPSGPQGPSGAAGGDGTNGTNGADGIAGARWYSGNGAPSSSIGATGDYYLDGTSGNIWTRTPSQWFPSGENIMGPTGNGGSDILPLDNTWTGLNTFSGGNIVANAGNGLFYGAQGESTNVAIGSSALALATAGQNIGLGDSAGASITTGASNLAIGASAMILNSTGTGNVAVGQGSFLFGTGTDNVAIGRSAGSSLVAGNNNTVIGSGLAAAFMNDTVLIGAGATERLKVDATGATINGTETVFTKEALQAVVAASTDFADFKTRVAAL